MNEKNVAVAGRTLMFVLFFGLNVIMNRIIAYDIAKFNGMRPMDDPVMLLFLHILLLSLLRQHFSTISFIPHWRDPSCRKGFHSGSSCS